ncbi:transporter substrate-binding domain-containing protein [Teredinibacter franksiae]|uniref:transporter substrate-binding domain-containing protein n=1 Tax=Teredinibacter franksiae TaxID=2761453 RepID=UPI00162867FB|nr:transporter substrate-binding domain-containing protein [Teredinibacter franksiae]
MKIEVNVYDRAYSTLRLTLATMAFLLPMSLAAEYSELHLNIPAFKPYQYMEKGKPGGVGVIKLSNVLNRMQVKYRITSVPNYGRAVLNLRNGHSSGFFLASQNTERDKLGVFSAPLMINNWVWVLTSNSTADVHSDDFKRHRRVGTFLHSNTHKWLIKNEYQRILPSMQAHLLPRQLYNKRLDAVFLAETVFVHHAKKDKLNIEHFKFVVEAGKPFGAYISKSYLKQNSGFMEEFNSLILKANKSSK